MLPKVTSGATGKAPTIKPASGGRRQIAAPNNKSGSTTIGGNATTKMPQIKPKRGEATQPQAVLKPVLQETPQVRPPVVEAITSPTGIDKSTTESLTIAEDPGNVQSAILGVVYETLAPAAQEIPVVAVEAPLAEAPPVPVDPTLLNGQVQLLYEQYDEFFPLLDGCISQADIDEVYCLTFVMPGCRLHLSLSSPAERTRLLNEGSDITYLPETPDGVFSGLVTSSVYYIYVEQEVERLLRDQVETQQRLSGAQVTVLISGHDQGTHNDFYEKCSCIYGNPCVNEYICKDWNNRYAIATKHGWKGF